MSLYPPGFPYKGTAISGIKKNADMIPALLVVVVQMADWWAKQNVGSAEKLRIARYLREAYVTVEEITDEMQEPGFWQKYDLFVVTGNLERLLDRLAPSGLYFGAKKERMHEYGYYSDEGLVGPLVLWE